MKSNNNVKVCKCKRANPYQKISTRDLEQYPINTIECVYEIDFELKKISFGKGFDNVFGYYNGEVNYTFLYDKCHPEDAELVNNILNSATLFNLDHPGACSDNKLFISLRLRRSDGTYIKCLCKYSTNSTDLNGHIKTILGVIIDVSFMDSDEAVKWSFHAKGLKEEEFRNKIYKEYHDFFTDRELDIIKQMYNNTANEVIAKNLYISKHTVATHRKRILKKSNCHSPEQLITFCASIGIQFA